MAHIYEVVYNLVRWFDEKIFRLYPTWNDCLAAGIFPRAQLESFFGKEGNQHGGAEGAGGPGHYKQCAERGIGRRVLAKMLAGTANIEEIRKAMDNFPMTERHLSKYRDCRRGPRRGLCRCDPSAPADANVTYKPNF